MDAVGQDLFDQTLVISSVTPVDLLTALAGATGLSFILALIYRYTHKGYSYSRAFLETLVIVAVTVTLIMVIIGSDIARAFALVGAMSIVRFRTPVKDSRDLVFVFAAIAIGMACGTQFLIFAVIFTGFVGALLLIFHFARFGEVTNNGYVLKIRIRTSDKERVADLCNALCRRYSIVSINRINGDDLEDVIYEVELKRGVTYKDLVEGLTNSVKPENVSILVGEGNVKI